MLLFLIDELNHPFSNARKRVREKHDNDEFDERARAREAQCSIKGLKIADTFLD
jgi:hypothetical protein